MTAHVLHFRDGTRLPDPAALVSMFVGRGVVLAKTAVAPLSEAEIDRMVRDKALASVAAMRQRRVELGMTVRGTKRQRVDMRGWSPERKALRAAALKRAAKRRYNQRMRERLYAAGKTARGTDRIRVGYKREWNRRVA